MKKAYFYESDRFAMFRDNSMENHVEDEDMLEVPEELLKEFEEAQKAFDTVQKKIYNLRKEQKGY